AADITGRIQIVAYWHDALHRVKTTGFAGGNGGATLDYGKESEPGASSGRVLVTKASYNDDGTVLDSIDANGIATRTLYDDAGRQVAQIRNYTGGSLASATRTNDLFTRYEYTDGQRITMWVDIDGDDVKDSD